MSMNRTIQWLKPILVAVGMGFTIWVLWFGGWQFVIELLRGFRTTFYTTLASICATLLGSAIAVVSIILLYSSNARLSVVVEQGQFPPLMRVFFDAIWALGATTLVTLCGLLVDRDASPSPLAFCLCVMCVSWAIATLIRCIYVFEKVVWIIASPSKARRGDQA